MGSRGVPVGLSWRQVAADTSVPAHRPHNLELFVWLLAWGVLIHKSRNADWAGDPAQLATSLMALALLFRPRDRVVLAGFAVAFLTQTWVDSPQIVNHWFLLAIVLVFVLSALVAGTVRAAPAAPGLDAVESRLFAAVRVVVVGLFAFAVLHKLNTGFLDTTLSCAVEHYGFLAATLPLLPESPSRWLRIAVIGAALAAEALIPCLLMQRRTRAWGVVLAVAFHYVMGINRFHTFSAPALALYVAFLPPQFALTLARMRRSLATRPASLLLWGRRLILAGMAMMVGVGIVSNLASAGDGNTAVIGKLAFLGLAPLFGVALVLTLRATPTPDHARLAGDHPPRRAWALVALTVMVVVGLSPYLGLRTQFALSMFSNLRTEPGEWNHLFLPERLRVAPLQDDLIEVVHAATPGGFLDPELANAIDLDRRLVRWEFERAVRHTCAAVPSLRIGWLAADGEPHRTGDACVDEAFAAAPSALLAKALVFKSVAAPAACQH